MRIFTDQRTGIKYADYVAGGKRRRVSLKTKDGKVAILRAGKLADDRQARNEGTALFEPFWEKYLANARATLRPRSVINLSQLRKKIDSFQKPKTLAEITPEYVDNFKIWLVNQGLARTSVNVFIGLIKSMVSKAETWGLTDVSLKRVKTLKTNVEIVEFHTEEEIKKILSIAPTFQWNVLVHFDARTGLRKSELLRLKWSDITFAGKYAEVYVSGLSKGYKFRTIPVRDTVLVKKLKTLKAQAKGQELVFNGFDDNISHNYTDWAEKSGLDCFLHKLRHTFASHLAQHDVPLQKIQKLLGHANIQTTMKYAHLLPSDLGGAVERLGDL